MRIGNAKYTSTDYIILDIYIPGTLNSKDATVHIYHKAYIINKLNAKLLIGIDILVLEDIYINFSKQTITIKSHDDILTPINLTSKDY